MSDSRDPDAHASLDDLVHPDVRRASTLPGVFYRDELLFERMRDAIAAHSWHYVGDRSMAASPGEVAPIELLDEPLLLTRDDAGELRALSNVCTHRGALLVEKACKSPGIRCRYHGRRFALDGRFVSMPEFESALDFPSPDDDLARASLGALGPMLFASLDPSRPFEDFVAPLLARLPIAIGGAVFEADSSKDYELEAHWALYVDNFLEGFHVPFVHPALNAVIDYKSYATELFEGGNVQIARAEPGGPTLPGTDGVASLYFWLFPCTMVNVYPWGISLNAVQPLGVSRTRVAYRTFVFPGHSKAGAGADLHRVEMEDEAIVESVQRGIRARLYRSGRFSPTREPGVHQFHRLLAGFARQCMGARRATER